MPVFVSPDGVPFRTENAAEGVRLKSRGYTLQGEPVTTFADEQFHPGDKGVDEVIAYMTQHPEQASRIIAEEKSGKARVTIVGSQD